MRDGELRILAEIFEVAAAERRARDVHARPQEHVLAVPLGFTGNRSPHALGKRGIERRRQQGARRERSGLAHAHARPGHPSCAELGCAVGERQPNQNRCPQPGRSSRRAISGLAKLRPSDPRWKCRPAPHAKGSAAPMRPSRPCHAFHHFRESSPRSRRPVPRGPTPRRRGRRRGLWL